nr:hypothetical protein [uncultured Roseateles sp.]
MKEVHAEAQTLKQACLRDADEAEIERLGRDVAGGLEPSVAGLQVLEALPP